MKIIHIIASPRGGDSNTLKISQEFLTSLMAVSEEITVETVDLYQEDLPAVAGDNIDAKYELMVGRKIDPAHEESWRHIEALIAHFLQADLVLISTPMWNFSIPYALKYYIDCLLQPGYTFGYDAHGAFGMVTGRRLVVVTSRGSDYSAGPMLAYDFLEPYLRTVFGMIGFQEMDFINAQPMDIDRDRRQSALLEAAQAARELATEIGESLEAAA